MTRLGGIYWEETEGWEDDLFPPSFVISIMFTLPVVNILAKVSVILGRVNNNVGPWTETKIIYLCSETCIIQPRDY